jgi:hypothetical protein
LQIITGGAGMLLGLYDSIKILLDDLIIVREIKIEFRHAGFNEEDLDEKLQLTIFRIVQEQLNNILKHGSWHREYRQSIPTGLPSFHNRCRYNGAITLLHST